MDLADVGNMNASGPISGLSTRAEKLIRVLSTFTVLALAVAAAILSFSGLQQLSLKAGISHSIAWLLPVVIDGLVLTGSLGVVSSSLVGLGTWYPWTLTIVGVIASDAGNVAIAHPNISSRLVHAAGPITFALSIEGLLRIYRASALATAHREKARLAKEEADFEKQLKKEEREARKEARLLEASQHPSGSQTAVAPIITPTSTTPTNTPVATSVVETVETIEPKLVKQLSLAHKTGATKERVRALLEAEPEITGAEVARRLELDDSYARKTLRDIRKENEDNSQRIVNEASEVKATIANLEVKSAESPTTLVESDPFA